jgi:phage gp36-like protein
VAQVLATPADFIVYGIAGGQVQVNDPNLPRYLSAASAKAIGLLRKRYKMPLASWGDDLRCYVCQLAAYAYWQASGYKVQDGARDTIRDNYRDALENLKVIANGRADLDDVVDATPDEDEGWGYVASDSLLVDNYADPDILVGT